MALSAFQRMHDRLFARLGEQAVLRGSVACVVNIERNVTVQYEIGDPKFYQSEYAQVVDIANIKSSDHPAHGDALVLASGEAYVVDAVMADNGYMARCVLRSA